MKSVRSLLSPLLGLLVVLLLLAGCYMPAAPDVTPTPSQQDVEEVYMATVAAQAVQTSVAMTEMAVASPPATETPTPPPPVPEETTPEPTPAPTEIPTVVPMETPTSTPVPPPISVTEVAPPPASAERTHVVRQGEWLLQIARQYGVDWRELAAYNNIVNPNRIYPDQVLRIPGTGGQPPTGNEILYTVQPGDNLFRIALRYNLNYLYLASYNGIANPHQIRVGQVIRIPVSP